MKFMFVTIALLFSFVFASAHSGRTNAQGCHHDRKNGGYHCHRANDTDSGPSRTVSSESDYARFNTKSKKFHNPNCMSAKSCTVNCIGIKKADAAERGGKPCGICGG